MRSAVASKRLQTPGNFIDKTVSPNELEIDGKALGDAELAVYDDGTHGDRFAYDGIWTRGGITSSRSQATST